VGDRVIFDVGVGDRKMRFDVGEPGSIPDMTDGDRLFSLAASLMAFQPEGLMLPCRRSSTGESGNAGERKDLFVDDGRTIPCTSELVPLSLTQLPSRLCEAPLDA
jgi:hypothetical protein